ncbi:MAG TPA: Na+/H+ antiporter NhaA [Vicinamibacterales bacterium]
MTHPHATTPSHVAHGASYRAVRLTIRRYLLVPIGALIALIWANTAPESYFQFSHGLSFFVNEIAMAFVFALLGQEVFEATMPGGALHSWRKWTLPLVAAAGGIVGSAAIYLGFIQSQYEPGLASGWPIATAVDVVLAFYLLRALMPGSAALPFALLLAIVTNIFGMVVVAPQYLVLQTRVGGAALAIGALFAAWFLRIRKVDAFWPYLLICGTAMWVAFYWEGWHPAFALVPLVPFLPHEARTLDVFADPRDDDAVHHEEHEWHLAVQPIVFLFALVNAGVILRGYDTATWGVLLASLIGRPLGVLIAVALAVAAGLHLPRRIGWRELIVIAFATSSGFSIALFFAAGMIATGPVLAAAKIGVIASAGGALVALAAAAALKVGRFGS